MIKILKSYKILEEKKKKILKSTDGLHSKLEQIIDFINPACSLFLRLQINKQFAETAIKLLSPKQI